MTEPFPGWTRAETVLGVWAIGAVFAFIPYTAVFGGLPDEVRRRWPRVFMIAWEVAWAFGCLWMWWHP